jgi:hypothetical protein
MGNTLAEGRDMLGVPTQRRSKADISIAGAPVKQVPPRASSFG